MDDTKKSFSVLEFRRAFEGLSEETLGKLHRVAGVLALKTGGQCAPREVLDLAVLSILEGRRPWPSRLSIEQFLIGAMRSVASHSKPPPREVPLPETEPPSREVECSDEESELATRLVLLFEEQQDDDAALLLYEFARGSNGAEAREELGLTQQQYETIMKRIRRRAEREGLTPGGTK